MSETTPETESAARPHLQPVREEQSAPTPAQSGPVRQGGGHMTGLLALLLAVAVFAFLAQFSTNRELRAENQQLQDALAASQAELQASQGQMSDARDALGGLRDVLARIEGLLMPPASAPAAEAAPGPGAAEPAPAAE